MRPNLRNYHRADVVAPDLVVVHTPEGATLLEGRLLPLLVPYLEGGHTEAEIVAALAGRATVLDVRFGLSLLEERGFLAKRRTGGEEPPPVSPAGWEIEAFRPELAGQRVEVRALGTAESAVLAPVLEVAGLRSGDGGPLVVLTDDYLHPGVGRLAEEAEAAGRAWMLLAPLAPRLWIGPAFAPPSGPGRRPCPECMARRLEANQPYRDLPVLASAGSTAAPLAAGHPVLAAAAAHVLRFLAAGRTPELEGRLLTLESTTLEEHEHRITPLPHCPRCGRPPDPRRLPGPPELAPRSPLDGGDGGWRVVRPVETLAALAHHVSPITGLVGWVRDHGDPPVREADGAPIRLWVADHLFPSAEPVEALRTGQRRRSTGKGISGEQARASALCEALERYSGVFQGHEPRRRARFSELGETAIHPGLLLGFSEAQYREREHWNHPGWPQAHVPLAFDKERPVDWTPLWSLTEARVKYLPTACCYFHVPQAEAERFARSDSNGNAAGTCLEEALLQGLLELVERDAAGLWWQNRLRRPGVAAEGFRLLRAFRRRHAGLGREVHALDLTSDLGIPAFVALSWAADGRRSDPLFGFGAHFEAEIALARALTEMNQFLPGLLAGRERRILSAPLPDDDFLLPAPGPERRPEDFPHAPLRDLRAAILHVVDLARERGLETLVLEQTRLDVGLAVTKVFVPGLCHFWPRRAHARLYDVPVAQGWLSRPRREDQLNPVHLLI